MSAQLVAMLVAAAYFVFSVVYLARYGFEDPRRAIWVGLAGILVMGVAMTVRTLKARKK